MTINPDLLSTVIDINFGDDVEVKLTEAARLKYIERYAELIGETNAENSINSKTNHKGWSVLSMRVIMETYGDWPFLAEGPFVNDIIRIPADLNKIISRDA